MKKQNYIDSFITFNMFTIMSYILWAVTQNVVLAFSSWFPVLLSYVTLRYSDNKTDLVKSIFWWPFYL